MSGPGQLSNVDYTPDGDPRSGYNDNNEKVDIGSHDSATKSSGTDSDGNEYTFDTSKKDDSSSENSEKGD